MDEIGQLENQVWRLEWPHGHAEVRALGAMLGPVWFRLENGQEFQPMHVAPWVEEATDLSLTGLLSSLRGEWPCVPFGTTTSPVKLPPGWTAKAPDSDGLIHGFAAHSCWFVREARPDFLHLVIHYPENSPVVHLERKIQADPNGPALMVTLCIRVRSEVDLPVALHSTFRLPKKIGSLMISTEKFGQAVATPCPPEPGISRIRPDMREQSLLSVDAIEGQLDLSRLPLPFATEELVQLVDCHGPIHLHYLDENACVTLEWDQQLLPDALLWISNGGRAYPPWSGRHFALGVEPLGSPFDLGRVATPPSDHPLGNRLLRLSPDEETTICYKISASCSRSLAG
jgi:hypothetical protein